MNKITTLFFVILLFSCQQSKHKIDPSDSFKNMILIERGEFIMGDTSNIPNDLKKPIHTVKINSFYLNKYEVTVKEFSIFINETGYITDSEKKDSSLTFVNYTWKKAKSVNWRHDATGVLRPVEEYNHPVVHVSWNDANAYCTWLSSKTGRKYRLPTEAEWEFAARNRGENILFSWGNNYPEGKKAGNIADETLLHQTQDYEGWHNFSDGFLYTAPVGSFDPNRLGLFDMSGNVWEWCSNWYNPNSNAVNPQVDTSGTYAGTDKSFRGGCWFSNEDFAKITFHKFGNPPDQSYGDFGFRIAMSP